MSLVSEPIFFVQNQNNYVMFSNKTKKKIKKKIKGTDPFF